MRQPQSAPDCEAAAECTVCKVSELQPDGARLPEAPAAVLNSLLAGGERLER